MKNLKKALALVLVIVMAFSFATLAGAKYNDDASITYDEAVGVMTGIGAIDGYTDGSFKPTGLVTRAEAAKMVTYAILGPTVAAALSNTATSFSDVPATHWAASYIGYCVSQGILNGRGDGTYDPNGNVTAFELAKMMLCAAGYGQNSEYVGPGWSINVAKTAMQNDIFEGNESANFSASATREEAALYVFNGIYNVAQVDYNELFGYYGKGSSVTNPDDGMTIAKEVYKMNDMKGLVTGGSMNGAVESGTYVSKATISDDGKVTAFATPTLVKFEAKTADLGQLLSIYYNETTNKPYYTETVSGTIGSFGVYTAYTYNTTFGSASFGPAAAMYSFANSYKTASLYSIGMKLDDGEATERTLSTRQDIATEASAFWGIGSTAPMGMFVTYGGEVISYAAFADQTFTKVTAISKTAGSESITFASLGAPLSNKASNDLIKEYEGIKVGDYVVLTKSGDIFTADKATSVDGKISKIDYMYGIEAGPSSITMDGKAYSMSGAAGIADLTEAFPSATADYTDNTYTLYLDASGSFITSVLKSGANTSSVVYVADKAWEATGEFGATVFKVQAVNTAGDQVVYTAASKKDVDNVNIKSGFYKVTVDSNTGMASFDTDITTADLAAHATPDTLTSNEIINGAYYYYGSDVNFIFVTNSGSDLKITKVAGLAAVAGTQLEANAMLYFNKTANPNKTVSTVIIPAAFTGSTTAKTLFLAKGTVCIGTNADGYQYSVYLNGVRTTITAKDSNISALVGDHGNFVNYTIDSKGVYDFGTAIGDANKMYTEKTVGTDGIFNGYISTTDGDAARPASNIVVVDLATSPFDPPVYTSVAAMEAVTGTKDFTISYVKNADGEISILFVTAAADA